MYDIRARYDKRRVQAIQYDVSFPKPCLMKRKDPPVFGNIALNSPYTSPIGIHTNPTITNARAIDGPEMEYHPQLITTHGPRIEATDIAKRYHQLIFPCNFPSTSTGHVPSPVCAVLTTSPGDMCHLSLNIRQNSRSAMSPLTHS
jgi:hypothetical protein